MHCGWQQVCESGALYTVMPPPSSPALPVPVSPALPGPGFSCSLSRAGAQSQSGPPCETVTLSPVTRCQQWKNPPSMMWGRINLVFHKSIFMTDHTRVVRFESVCIMFPNASEIITNQMRLFLPLSFNVLCRHITRSLFLYKVSLSTLHTTTEYERDLPTTDPPQVTGVVTTHTVSISVSHQASPNSFS